MRLNVLPMSKRILIITQKVDETDDLLGFFVAWLREFSKHVERVDVITLESGEYQLPPNVHVHSLGKEHGALKLLQVSRFVRFLWRYTPNIGGVFCHMSPIFAILAWPFARLRRARLVLWYLHRSNTFRLRLALRLCNYLVTADTASLTIQSPNIVSVGHGIDVERFSAQRNWTDINNRPIRVMSVGRLAQIKDFSTFIRAIGILRDRGIRIESRIIGRAILPEHYIEENALHNLVHELKLQEVVKFVGFVPYSEMPDQYKWADIVVGCTPRGGLDKAILEGMAAGCIAITSNDAMRSTLESYANELIFPHGNFERLADIIQNIHEHAKLSSGMIASARSHHNLTTAINRIVHLL